MEQLQGIVKYPTGIVGFDEATEGGLPQGRTTLVVGGPGTGKTTFVMQLLVNGAIQFNEPGIFVAFEEKAHQIVENAAGFGWNLPALQQDRLFLLDVHIGVNEVLAGDFDLSGILQGLSAKVREMGARRIAFDSIDVLLGFLKDDTARRRELYRLHEWLASEQLMGIITAKVRLDSTLTSMRLYDEFLHYMADVVVAMDHNLQEHISQRRLRVVKYRGSAFYESDLPFVIGPHGLDVACAPHFRQEYPVYTERVSTGIEQMDTMLTGGYIKGSSVLISGSPGTAKSTLAGSFVNAGCQNGERCMYVSFDEGGTEIIRNLTSVSIDLMPHVESGLLRFHSARSETRSAEEHRLVLESELESFRPDRLVIDHISALLNAGPRKAALAVAQRIIYLAKRRGITLLCTSLISGDDILRESTKMEISTIADVWIHLSYVVQAGERNRALTIVKSRGTGHSNQVRELILTDSGITLADVYTSGGEVLMGTMRWEKQQEVIISHARATAEIEHRILRLRREAAQSAREIEALGAVAQSRELELKALDQERTALEKQWDNAEAEVWRRRAGDEDLVPETEY